MLCLISTLSVGRRTGGTKLDPIDVAVGGRARLRRRLIRRGQVAVAAEIGVSFQQLHKYERGQTRLSVSMLVRLARALETTVAALVGEADGAPAIPPHALADLSTDEALDLLAAWTSLPADQRALLLALVQRLAAAAPES
jgi:transcriptional regulator with XRE-family HTH domain